LHESDDKINEYCACSGPTFSHIIKELNQNNNGINRRRKIIEAIEEKTGSKVIVYTASFDNPMSSISGNDIIPYEDMLASIGNTKSISLILHSPGGDPNSAEKIIKMTRNYCDNFRVIVPNSAKSAATLIALGSDEIMMGHLSELGPIDPQITYKLPNGQWVMRPGQSIIDSFMQIKKEIEEAGKMSQAYIPILNNIDIALLDYCKKASVRSKELAQKLLGTYMLKDNNDKAKQIAENLANANIHLSHARVIDRNEAKDMGLNIKFIEKEDDLWKLIWELHCWTIMALSGSKAVKIFETATSLLVQGGKR
jgi:ClpP class serine protease